MSAPPLTLGTAGHIDHGKTVLVRALTGVDTDRLPEERARGISIELGFARLELPSGRALSVVDVPGHERFVRTMVAGATGVDLFLLVVAADDGVMPQTREHLAVLQALEVPRGVVALTKVDAVERDQRELAIADVRDLLGGTPHEGTAIVPVSALTGDGLEHLRETLDGVAAATRRRPAEGPARLHVDRSFTLKGIGTVVTGTLWSGELRSGDEVRIEPGARRARIRTIEVHDHALERVSSGQRVALNLAGVDRTDIERGSVVTVGAGLVPTYLVDALVEVATPIRLGTRVHVHHGTRESPARIAPLEGETLQPGVPAFAQLRLEQALVPAAGDRFVLRQIAPPDTIGGGSIVDARPRKHGAGPAHVRRLATLASGNPLERLALALEEAPAGVEAGGLDAELAEQLRDGGRAEVAGQRWFAPQRLAEACASMAEALDRAGPRPASRGALARGAGLTNDAAGAVLDSLVAAGKARPLGPGFVAGGESADPVAVRLLEVLAEDGLEPRATNLLADAVGTPADRVRETLDRLTLEDGVVRVKPGLYYHRHCIESARRRVVELCERDGAVTIAGLRDDLGTSRKYAQALLEHFDSTRITRRRGDEHVLR
jgi:selenocysteine-specific elongation factor